MATVGDIADVRLGKMLSDKAREQGLISRPYLRNENVRWGTINFDDVKSMGFKAGEIERYGIEPGDLLACEGGEPGRCAVYRGPSGTWMYQKALHRVRPGPAISADLLQYWLRHMALSGALAPKIAQTTIQHLPLERFVAVEVPVPPTCEQRRIVLAIEQHLSDIDAGVAALERVRANLKRYRASVLKAACEGRLVPTEAELARKEKRKYEPADVLLARILKERRARWETDQVAKMKAKGQVPRDGWKGRYEEPKGPETSGLAELPEGWAWTCLEPFNVCIGATPSRAKAEYWGGGIPWVSSGEVAFCRIRATRETISEAGLRHTSTTVHPPGTVLLGMIGEGRTRGQVAILDIAACNNQNAAAIRVGEAGVSAEYVYSYLESVYEQTRRVGGGNNQPALNKSRVERMLVPLPPLAEQRRLCAESDRLLSVSSQVEQAVSAQLARATRLRQAVLKRAFEGKLVPQDPNDEPASVMLERVRRGAAPGAPGEARARRGKRRRAESGA